MASIAAFVGVSAHAADLPVKAKPIPPAGPTWWVSGSALLWSVKSTPLPPTLTTFTAGSPSAVNGFGGALGFAGTTVLSPDHLNYGTFPGGRFTAGHWFADPRFGAEIDGFFLGNRSASFGLFSDGSAGSLPLRIPFNNVPPGAGFPLGSSSFLLADPGFARGGQAIDSSLKLWGIEGNGLLRTVPLGPVNITLLGGLRYIDLRENLSIVSTESIFPLAGSLFTGADYFSTKNQFLGAQFGAKAQQQFGQFDLSATAKVAIGNNYQTISINGLSTAVNFGTVPSSPGGIFSQTTNIGQRTYNQFAVVPEVQLQAGYRLQNGLRFFVGYEFLYINNVVRPGNQIDTTINFTSNAIISGIGTLAGAARPAPQIVNSSFWAQGARLGASYAF